MLRRGAGGLAPQPTLQLGCGPPPEQPSSRVALPSCCQLQSILRPCSTYRGDGHALQPDALRPCCRQMEEGCPTLLLAGCKQLLELARAETSGAAESYALLAAAVLSNGAGALCCGWGGAGWRGLVWG